MDHIQSVLFTEDLLRLCEKYGVKGGVGLFQLDDSNVAIAQASVPGHPPDILDTVREMLDSVFASIPGITYVSNVEANSYPRKGSGSAEMPY